MYRDDHILGKIRSCHSSPTGFQKLCLRIVFNAFQGITTGSLLLILPNGKMCQFGNIDSGLQTSLKVRTYSFFPHVVFGGDVGFGEAYMDGEWESDSVVDLIALFIINKKAISGGHFKTAIPYSASNFINYMLRRNTVLRSRDRIKAHYDTGNAFFQSFLDTSMTYSCALYASSQDTLAEAQINKLEAIIKKARIKSTDHVLDIGCGWGSFAIEAAKRTGCRVTAITISDAQFRYARERVRSEKLTAQIDIQLKDYRQVRERFNKIVSIEMLEAVGHQYYGAFFRCCQRLLKSEGIMVLQVITCQDDEYEITRKRCGWITKHIFPGGLIPSLSVLCQAMAHHSDFVIESIENIGLHYARTLRDWRTRYLVAWPEIAQMGFDQVFFKKWLYYFSYCEAGFATRHLNDLQIVLCRSRRSNLSVNSYTV